MKHRSKRFLGILLSLVLILGLLPGMSLTALADGDADETVTLAENASLDGANTSRNLAVGRDGVIHIAYRSVDSIFYRKSTNSGSTFSEPVTVATGNECEVAVSSTGRVFVAYVNNSNLYIAYSDNGTSFTPVPLEASSDSLHIAVDGSHVYAILQNGTQFFYSSDGGQSYESYTGWTGYMFSDVHVDESNHNVVILKDNPNVVCRYSSDYGATFSDESPVKCGEDQIQVYYSTATVGNGYAYMAGNNAGFESSTDYLYKIDYINATATGTLISACDSQNGRSLSADHNGNVVVGYVSTGKACYQTSLDGGDTVGSGVEFADARAANAAINTKTGDVLFLYESDGKIMLHKAAGVVPGDSIVYNGEWQYLLDSRFEPVCQEEGARYVLGTNDQTAPTEGWGDAIPQGKDAGFYYVWVQSNTTDSTCKIVEIVKANALKTKPEGVAAINYNGEAQALAVAGEAASGKIVYALGESDTGPAGTAYSETIPTAAEKGDYTVWYKVVGFDAQNYYADEPQSVKSNIDIYHTLTYAPGDGTGEPFTVMVKDGTSTTIPKNKFTAPDGKFHHNPVFRLLVVDRADLETVIPFLTGYRSGVNRIDQQVFDDTEIPHVFPVFRVDLFPAGEGKIPQSTVPSPPGGRCNLRVFQPAPDKIRAVSLCRQLKDVSDNGRGFFVNQQMPVLVRVFPVSERRDRAGEYSLSCRHQIGRMHLLRYITAVKFVEYIFERSNFIIVHHGVDVVVQRNITHAMTGKEVLDQMARLQIIAPQAAQIFGNDQIDDSLLCV